MQQIRQEEKHKDRTIYSCTKKCIAGSIDRQLDGDRQTEGRTNRQVPI